MKTNFFAMDDDMLTFWNDSILEYNGRQSSMNYETTSKAQLIEKIKLIFNYIHGDIVNEAIEPEPDLIRAGDTPLPRFNTNTKYNTSHGNNNAIT